MKYPPITYRLLKKYHACKDQLDLFEKHIGLYEPIPLNEETIQKFRSIFDFDWAAYHLLDEHDWREFFKTTDLATTEFDKESAEALAEYKKALNTVHDKLWKAKATEFVRIYNR